MFNNLNLKLQGRKNTTILANYDHIQRVLAKLQLFSSRVSSANVASFTRLDECLKGATNNVLKVDILQHLRCLAKEFSRYQADIDPESPSWRLTRNRFIMNVLQLSNNIQEEFLDFKADSTAKDDFQLLTFEQLWLKRYKINSCVAEGPPKTLVQFSSTYLCQAGFSAIVSIRTKQQNRRNTENDLRVALSSTQPRMDLIVKNKQSFHVSFILHFKSFLPNNFK
nr:unnamed protein product [Callosobruchus analis]